MSTSTKKGRSSRRSTVGLGDDVGGLLKDELGSIIAEESMDESSVAPLAGGEEEVEEPSSQVRSRGKRGSRVSKVVPREEELQEDVATAPVAAATGPAPVGPIGAIGRLFTATWFLFSSIFVYLYQLLAMAGNGVLKFANFALRRSDAPSKFETGKNLFWLAVALGLAALIVTNYPRIPLIQESVSEVTVHEKVIVDERAVKELRNEVQAQFKQIADSLKTIRSNLKENEEKDTAAFDLIQKLTKASEEMGNWIKAAGAQTDQSSDASQATLQALQNQANSMAQQLASLSSLEARQNATLESALAELETKLVLLQDQRDAKLREEIQRVQNQFVTLMSSQDGKVQAIEPDEGKIRQIAQDVLQTISQKYKDEVVSSALSAVSEDNIRRLVREAMTADSDILKSLYENHIKAQVNAEATKTAAEVASHLITEAATTIAGEKTSDEQTPQKPQTQPISQQAPDYVSISKEEIVRIVAEQLEQHVIGGVAMPDYALKKAGAHVVPHMTQARGFPVSSESGAFKKFIGQFLPPAPRAGPEEALKPVVSASDCWPFHGGSANMTVELTCPIKPTHITLDHIHPSLTPHPESAPKTFRVWAVSAVSGPSQKKHLLGEYTYDINTKKPVQTFPVQHPVQSWTPYISLEILDNWGHWYTCLYRLRVHGEPSDACKSKI